MFGNFITAPEVQERSAKKTIHTGKLKENDMEKVKTEIRELITKMPQQSIRLKAALNAGISAKILDFNKILLTLDEEKDMTSLNLIQVNLKNLEKEIRKIKRKKQKKRSGQENDFMKRSGARTQNNSSRLSLFSQQKQGGQVRDEREKAIEAEMAFRIKLKKFYSTDKINKKEEILMKKAQRAKQFNTKAAKVMQSFKMLKLKEQKSLNIFQTESMQSPKQAVQKKFIITDLQNPRSTHVIHVDAPCQEFEENDVASQRNAERCKTSNGLRYTNSATVERKYIQPSINSKKFAEHYRREIQTRERKRQIMIKQEENAIARMINKQQMLIERSQRVKQSMKKDKQNIHGNYVSKVPSMIHQNEELEEQIKEKCEQKVFKKEIHLKEKVTKIREDLKAKKQRMDRHRIRKQQWHEDESVRNDQYMRNYMAKLKLSRDQKEIRHELSIRNRFEQGEIRKKMNEQVNQVTRWPDEILQKQYKKIKDKELMSSLKNIFLFHCIK